MKVDLQKNLNYYKSEGVEVCSCDACRSFCMQIKEKYPEIAEYLSTINVDVLKPFELVWIEDEERTAIRYIGCQYIVFGTCDDDFTMEIDGIAFEKNIYNHPSTGIADEHFVLDFGEIILEMMLPQ